MGGRSLELNNLLTCLKTSTRNPDVYNCELKDAIQRNGVEYELVQIVNQRSAKGDI